jgi:hypothetical protein
MCLYSRGRSPAETFFLLKHINWLCPAGALSRRYYRDEFIDYLETYFELHSVRSSSILVLKISIINNHSLAEEEICAVKTISPFIHVALECYVVVLVCFLDACCNLYSQ